MRENFLPSRTWEKTTSSLRLQMYITASRVSISKHSKTELNHSFTYSACELWPQEVIIPHRFAPSLKTSAVGARIPPSQTLLIYLHFEIIIFRWCRTLLIYFTCLLRWTEISWTLGWTSQNGVRYVAWHFKFNFIKFTICSRLFFFKVKRLQAPKSDLALKVWRRRSKKKMNRSIIIVIQISPTKT